MPCACGGNQKELIPLPPPPPNPDSGPLRPIVIQHAQADYVRPQHTLATIQFSFSDDSRTIDGHHLVHFSFGDGTRGGNDLSPETARLLGLVWDPTPVRITGSHVQVQHTYASSQRDYTVHVQLFDASHTRAAMATCTLAAR